MTKYEISQRPLAGLFGSESAYRVLMYLENYDRGYASEIARTYDASLNQIQNQLNKFERLGLLVSRKEGSARVFYFKQGPVVNALRTFLASMLDHLPEETVRKYYRKRTRPRRHAKR